MAGFRNKVAIVTGSSQGIGRAVAQQLLEEGAQVAINGRNRQRLEVTAATFRNLGYEPLVVVADVSKKEDCGRLVQQVVRQFGRIDILINNAGLSMEGELDELNPDVFRRVIEVNLLGSANATTAALSEIIESQGSVLFISSLAGLAGLPGYSAYSASKMALTALAQSLRSELHGQHVHVGVAYPGFTKNDPQKQVLNAQGEIISQPARDFVNAAPVENVAAEILDMITYRQANAYFGSLGKLAAFINWMSPGVFNWFVRRMYKKHIVQQKSLGEVEYPNNDSNLTVFR